MKKHQEHFMNQFYFHLFILLITLPLPGAIAEEYQWPLKPFNQQHNLSATFCENRPDGDVMIHHFHNAIDIPLTEGGEVYAVQSGYVEDVVRTGYSAYIRVGRYNYLHVNPLATLSVNDYVEKEQLVGHTNYANHIHLIDGYYPNYINPIRVGGITPFTDTYVPTVSYVRLYADGSTAEFTEGRVTGRVDIVARLYDRTDSGSLGSNNGIYVAGYQIYDSSGTVPLTDPVTTYQFDVQPSNAYIRNVYFPGSDLSTYIYILTNKIYYNGYWDTREYEPGIYKIRVFTGDTRNNFREVWKTVEVARQDNTSPAKPELLSFIGTAEGNWDLNWLMNDSSDVEGYDFLYSLDGVTYHYQTQISAVLTPRDTAYSYADYGYDYPLYVNLQAYDDAPFRNFSAPSNAYGIMLSQSGPDYLIVDGFRRWDGYWKRQNHDAVVTYGEILRANGISFNSCSSEAIALGRVRLNDYRRVIIVKGDSYGLSEAEQKAIASYLEQGGQLFISGANIAGGLHHSGDSLFLQTYLKSNFVSDSSTTLSLTDPEFLKAGTLTAPFGQYPSCDVITRAGDDVRPAFVYDDSKTAAVASYGRFGTSLENGTLFYCAFPLEHMESRDIQNIFYQDVIAFFDQNTGHTGDLGEALPSYAYLINYPNPFNAATRIRYAVPSRQTIRLEIYDRSGRLVEIPVRGEERRAGYHELSWHAENRSSGVYICRITGETFGISRKLLLLK